MSDEETRRTRGAYGVGGGRRLFDGAYGRADRALDRGQRHVFRVLWFFLPETSVAKQPRFQQVFASRFFSDAGQQALAYGALIAVVRGSGSAVQAALVGVAMLLPPALLGLYGGAVADALPKRVALAAIYNLQAVLCVVIPLVFGTGLTSVLFLVVAVQALAQVSNPTESAVMPLVASEEQLASATSLVSLASHAGAGFGTGILAPVLVRVFSVNVAFYVAGAMLLIAATRVFDLSPPGEVPPEHQLSWRQRPRVNARATVEWLVSQQPAVATMIVVAVLAGTANHVVQTLGPYYVSAVVGVDPADSVYVFAPSSVGLLTALLGGPKLIRWRGERTTALFAMVVTTAMLCLLGLPDVTQPLLDPINPLRLSSLFGAHMGAPLRTAGLLAVPLGFGVALTAIAVNTYINRRVPLAYQGRAFALQGVLKNGSAIVPLLTLGAAASAFGVKPVLIASPFVLLLLAASLVQLSRRFGGHAPRRTLDVVASFWQEPGPEAGGQIADVGCATGG